MFQDYIPRQFPISALPQRRLAFIIATHLNVVATGALCFRGPLSCCQTSDDLAELDPPDLAHQLNVNRAVQASG